MKKKRAEKVIGSSLEAHIDIYLEENIAQKLKDIDFKEIAITSSATINNKLGKQKGFSIEYVKNVFVEVNKTGGSKCQRCWKYDDKVTDKEICDRCNDAIS